MPRCRGCGAAGLSLVVDLGVQPAAACFPSAEELSQPEPAWPLRMWVCAACWLVQLGDDGPDEGDDATTAAPAWSDTIRRHAGSFAAEVLARLGTLEQPRIVEMASHGGYLQDAFRARGAATIIAEGGPARADAAARGLVVERLVLNAETAARLTTRSGPADAVVDFYLLAHLRDPGALLAGIRALLAPEGIAAIEFDHLLHVIGQCQFDAIRHGHFSYLSLTALVGLLERAGLRVFDVEAFSVYGGAARAWVQDAVTGPRSVTSRVGAMLATEQREGLDRMETYRHYGSRVERAQRSLREFLEEARRDGRSVVGYGAPSRGTTLLNACGVTSDLLPFTVDRSVDKQGRFIPGVRVPVYAPDRLLEARPDYVLILTWDVADEIQEQLREVRCWGGRFVVPIPEARVLP